MLRGHFVSLLWNAPTLWCLLVIDVTNNNAGFNALRGFAVFHHRTEISTGPCNESLQSLLECMTQILLVGTCIKMDN